MKTPDAADESAAPPAATLVNPLDGLLGYQLRRASAWILADLAHGMADLDLRPTEVSIVRLIQVNDGITQSEIGRILAIKRANMTPLAAGLADRGLIEKIKADGRSQALRLTPRGEALAGEIERRIAVHETGFLPHLPPGERAKLTALIRSIWNRPIQPMDPADPVAIDDGRAGDTAL